VSPRTSRLFQFAVVAGAALSFFCSCASSEAVQRRRGDHTSVGRWIPPAAYSWYQRGLHHERSGDELAARNAFERTLDLDPESGSAWAALGRIVCLNSYESALRTFERGLKIALRPAPIYVERGDCRLRQETEQASALALTDGEFALALEPDNPDTTKLISNSLERLNRKKEADVFRRAAAIREGVSFSIAPSDQLKDLDRAIFQDDFRAAQSLAQSLMTPGELAIRILAWGRLERAREQARLVHEAAPSDQDAALALFLLGDNSTFDLSDSPPPSKLALLLFSLHLKRHVGERAAAHFQTTWQLKAEASDDPVWNSLLPERAFSEKF
jgi:tetratricopeptide (TPR) repeat protein